MYYSSNAINLMAQKTLTHPSQQKISANPTQQSTQPIQRVHERFRESDAFFCHLVESLDEYAIFTTDLKGTVSSWNKGAHKILGYKEKEILGKNTSLFFIPEDIAKNAHSNELQIALKKGKAKDERWHVRKDNSRFWGSGLVFPLKDDTGTIVGFTKIMRDLTERKKLQEEREFMLVEKQEAQEKVEYERHRLQNLFQHAPALIAILRGREGVVELFNPFFQKVWNKKNVVGKPMREAFSNTEKEWYGIIERVFDTGQPFFQKEQRAYFDRYNDGIKKEAYFNFVYTPSFDHNGKIDSVLIFGFEVTDQILSRERLRISEERLQLAQKSGKIGSFEWIIQQKKFIWTPELLTLYGITEKEITDDQTKWIDFIHPDDKQRVVKEAKLSAKTGVDLNSEFRVIWPDKTLHYIATRAQVFRDAKGKPHRLVGVNIDITDRKRIEKNLQFLAEASRILSSSLDYQTTLNNVAILAVPEIGDWCTIDILNKEGDVQQVAVAHKNPKKVKWAKELRKKQPVDMSAAQGLPQVLRTGKSELYPLITDEMLVALSKSKAQLKLMRTIGFTSALIVPLTRQGTPIGAITFVSTDSKRQYNEADLAMAEELAARASLAIENAWLYKGSKDAITLRDDFISVASHELKTPITSVKIFTQVLQHHSEQIGDKKAVIQLTKMDKQIDKLTELIYNLLDISKIQAGRMQFEEKLFDFDTMIHESIELLQHSTNHSIVVNGKTNKKVYGDQDRLGQVVSNLISNAIKYSPKSSKVVVHLTTDKKNVIAAVEDFGVGIEKEHLERIFERFYRVFDTNDKTFPGLGIGLYISSEIVKRHHGKFWVESVKGKGSKFFFSLPLNRDKPANGIKML